MFGDALRKEMALAGVKPAELARRLDVAESTVSRLAAGLIQDVTVDRLVQIERALDLPPGRLFRGAGLVVEEDGTTVRERLASDPLLSADELRIVLRIYDSSVAASAEERTRSSDSATPTTRRSRRN